MNFKDLKQMDPKKKTCRQCHYDIIPAPAAEDKRAQAKGFCCFGCEEVFFKLEEWDRKEAAQS